MSEQEKIIDLEPAKPEHTDIALGNRGLQLGSLNDLSRFAQYVARSDFAPRDFKGKPQEILIAIQMGAEVGFLPMQALQNIAVINGRPVIWGDAAKALVMASGKCAEFKEWMEGSIHDKTRTAYCEITRKDMEPFTSAFNVNDAERAGLWDKRGPWQQYPDRMLQMRARGFCIRDVFPDALKGLCIREEVQDYQEPIQQQQRKTLADVTQELQQKADLEAQK
jgi:hypothetical protein